MSDDLYPNAEYWAKRAEVAERLLADLHQMDAFARKQGVELEKVMKLLQDAEAELAEHRGSCIQIRRQCPTCEGDGQVAIDSWELHTCPDCVDGWQLVDGVRKVTYETDHYVIPAHLIEGDI